MHLTQGKVLNALKMPLIEQKTSLKELSNVNFRVFKLNNNDIIILTGIFIYCYNIKNDTYNAFLLLFLFFCLYFKFFAEKKVKTI